MLFDRLLTRRVEQGNWNTVLAGDLVKTTDRGGLFLSEDEQADAERAARGEVSATGPIFGPRMRWPEGEPARMEREVWTEATGSLESLSTLGKIGSGSRRALRLMPRELQAEIHDCSEPGSIIIRMTLPKGAYATTVLGAVFSLSDASIESKTAFNRGTAPVSS